MFPPQASPLRRLRGSREPNAVVLRVRVQVALSDLRAAHVCQLVLAGRALGCGARCLRRLPDGLGRARRAVGLLGRAHRGGSCVVCGARERSAGRRRRHDIALGGRERARVGDRLLEAAEGRDQRLRVPDDRADLACAAAARRRGARRRAGARRRGDRRADSGRLGDRGLLPQRRAAAGRGDRAGRARARRARACSTPTRRRARIPST